MTVYCTISRNFLRPTVRYGHLYGRKPYKYGYGYFSMYSVTHLLVTRCFLGTNSNFGGYTSQAPSSCTSVNRALAYTATGSQPLQPIRGFHLGSCPRYFLWMPPTWQTYSAFCLSSPWKIPRTSLCGVRS